MEQLTSMLTRDDLIASAHALARVGRDGRARVSFPDRVANAAAAGFAAVGTSPRDYLDIRSTGLSDDDIAAVLDDHGLMIGEIDGCPVWLAEGEPHDDHRALVDTVFHMAERFGPVHHTILPIVPDKTWGSTLPPDDVLADRCGVLADRAAALGMLASVEFVPWGPLNDAASTWALAQRSGREACGVNIDFWHHLTGSADERQLRATPGRRVHSVHFTDGSRI